MKRKSIATSASSLLTFGSLLGASLIGSSMVAQAATVNLTTNDLGGTTSFDTAGHWSDLSAPSAGNDYTNTPDDTTYYTLRTPVDALDHTFAGDSLTMKGSGLQTFAPQAQTATFYYKGNSATNATITINNFTIDGAEFRGANNGTAPSNPFTLAGDLTIGSGGVTMAQMVVATTTISAQLKGSGTIRLLTTAGAGGNGGVILTNATNTFNGNVQIYTATSKLTLDTNAVFNFTLGDSGVNNSISSGTGTASSAGGILAVNGVFKLDLSGFSPISDASWTLVTGSTLTDTYGGTFNLVDAAGNVTFTENANVWTGTDSTGTYSFNESTGALSFTAVPEPTTVAMIALGLGVTLWGGRRRRRA